MVAKLEHGDEEVASQRSGISLDGSNGFTHVGCQVDSFNGGIPAQR